AVEDVLAGAPRQHGAEDGHGLVQAVDLAAEAATHGAADEVQAVGGGLQELGGRVEREEQRLGRGVDHIAVVGLGGGDRTAGLGGGLLYGRHLVAALDELVGPREGGVD